MSRSLKKTFTIVAAGACLAMLLAVAAHGAAGVKTKVTLNAKELRHGSRLHGMLFTLPSLNAEGDKDVCLAHRKVVLFKVTQKGVKRQAAVRTDVAGDYKLRVDSAHKAKYFTKATKSVLADAYGNLVSCEPGVSQKLKI